MRQSPIVYLRNHIGLFVAVAMGWNLIALVHVMQTGSYGGAKLCLALLQFSYLHYLHY